MSVKAASLAAVGAAAMLTTAWMEQTPAPEVPECWAQQMKRGAVLTSGITPSGPHYLRFKPGPAEAWWDLRYSGLKSAYCRPLDLSVGGGSRTAAPRVLWLFR
jgi:hypothetical protein